jgi:ABC-type bacteriocin/lantibiotic exporter with double-glycine peptidase domain
MNCGAKCFRWILEQEGTDLTLERAREVCQTTAMGTREPDLRAALESYALQPELRQHLSWDELCSLSLQHYLVVLYQCHYSVVVSAHAEGMELYDPDVNAVIRRARATFEPVWNDYEIDLDWTRRDYERAAILIKRHRTETSNA